MGEQLTVLVVDDEVALATVVAGYLEHEGFTALQAHSYIGDYLLADPTLDRRAETILKLEEDLLGFPTYPSPRIARVTAGSPIAVKQMLVDGRLPAKGGAGELTTILEKELSSMLAEGVRIVA